jgi:hypothetical protein
VLRRPVAITDVTGQVKSVRSQRKPSKSSRNRYSINLRKPLDQRWHRIIRQMVEELAHRVDSDSASRTARHNNVLAALGYARRIINKVGKIVAVISRWIEASNLDLSTGLSVLDWRGTGRQF